MAGITDSVYRRLCKQYGAGLVFSELISSRNIIHQYQKNKCLLQFSPDEQPYAVQLLGNNPAILAESAKIVAGEYQPAFIDFNVGCPAPKVIRKHQGAALLRDFALLTELVHALCQAVSIPITVKIRSGWDNHSTAIKAAQLLQEAGAQAITLHARTVTQGYSGSADWPLIREVVDAIDIPVIGNGDIFSAIDARRMLNETQCAAVMIGRGAVGKPWIFREINELLSFGKIISPAPSDRGIAQICLNHLSQEIVQKGEFYACLHMRKIYSGYLQGWPNTANLKRKLNHAVTYREIEEIFSTHLNQMVPE